MCQFPPVPLPRHGYTSLRTHQETWGQCRDYKRDAVKVTSNVERVFIEDFTLSGDPSGETVMNSSLLIRLKDRAPLSDQVHQTPPDMVVAIKSGATVTLNCSHSIENYNTILWYKQQRNNKQLELLGNLISASDGSYPSF
ncbi:unnamed protein product [Arctogadus glacialis]